ncbi:MAG TPA: 4-hydroxy-tetrahydrodipicolinate synthase [Candidatus Excrementavichristensenella intestinipullorum]|nr:4-hydroxy-tetrahydrodipicolinate synthase [Candidatus Excrementavichristensenella intestinipullorum]
MFQGSFVALVTPFDAQGRVNFDKLAQLCKWHVAQGTAGIVALGTTGESSTMSHEEDEDVVRCVMETVGGRIPVIAGAGSNCTETALMKSLAYEKLGVDGLLLITPYYNKANEKGMYRHFVEIADQVHTPIVLYNVPGRTGCALSVGCVEALSKHKNIRALKEASGSISYAAKVARYITPDFELLSGNDDMIVPIMSLGGSGVISVWANICPAQTAALVNACLKGDYREGARLQLKYLDLINALFIEVNPIPVKEAMNMLGMEVGGYRLPLCPMDPANRDKLSKAMEVLKGV